MDRLLCGDVGFGKTEVAMRAAFKALGDGKQVAVLAPTTVARAPSTLKPSSAAFAPFPVRVAMFSRLIPSKELKTSVEELASGKIDLAIGTHRIFSKDGRVPRSRPSSSSMKNSASAWRTKSVSSRCAKNVPRPVHERYSHSAHPPHVPFWASAI